MKINITNTHKIEDALRAVNGKSTCHAYTTADDIQTIARRAEDRLDSIHIPKRRRVHAEMRSISGGKVARKYQDMRNATSVTLYRSAAGTWFLTWAGQCRIGTQGGGPDDLSIAAPLVGHIWDIDDVRIHVHVDA